MWKSTVMDKTGSSRPYLEEATPARMVRRRRLHHREFPAGLFLGGLLPSRARLRFTGTIQYSGQSKLGRTEPHSIRTISIEGIPNPNRSGDLTRKALYEGGQRRASAVPTRLFPQGCPPHKLRSPR